MRTLRDGQPAAYVCENFVCAAPVTSADALAGLLDEVEEEDVDDILTDEDEDR
jgi:uncharacterized protein YyaL (SSP411 family)